MIIEHFFMPYMTHKSEKQKEAAVHPFLDSWFKLDRVPQRVLRRRIPNSPTSSSQPSPSPPPSLSSSPPNLLPLRTQATSIVVSTCRDSEPKHYNRHTNSCLESRNANADCSEAIVNHDEDCQCASACFEKSQLLLLWLQQYQQQASHVQC